MLIIGIFYVSFAFLNAYAQFNSVEGDHDFDLLIFTQQWPATVCKEWKKNPSHTCSMPKKDDVWSIHGIWPTKLGTIGPAFCNRTWLFDPEKIRPIEDTLTEVWVNIYAGTSLYTLWAHEWNKHGTCAAILDHFNSEYKYFTAALEWFKQFSVGDMLTSANITPNNSKEYSITDIHLAIKNRLGVDPIIECKKEDGQNYISEIRICFTKSLRLYNCDGILRRKSVNGHSILTNCNTSKDVVYPHYTTSKSSSVQLYKLISWLQWFTL